MSRKFQQRKRNGIHFCKHREGINEIFRGLGVDYIIEGGQTMNPSTEDMLNAIEKVNAKNIFILPNNKNIIMAANQAASLTEDKEHYCNSYQDDSTGYYSTCQLYSGQHTGRQCGAHG